MTPTEQDKEQRFYEPDDIDDLVVWTFPCADCGEVGCPYMYGEDRKELEERLRALITADRKRVALEARKVAGDTSDGYHTFNELYDYRRVYNAALFNEWASQGKYDVHKSWKHSDGKDCFGGGWFIVVAELPTGQASNHYEAQYWDNFAIPSKDTANEYDGHTPKQALSRIAELKAQQEKV